MASILVCTTRLSPISYRRLEYVSYHTFKQALAAFEMALQHNPKSTEVSRKIKRLGQLQKDKQRAQELETLRSNVDMAKHLESFKSEMSDTYRTEDCWKEMFSFIVETMETAVKSWHETSRGTEDCWKEMFSFIFLVSLFSLNLPLFEKFGSSLARTKMAKLCAGNRKLWISVHRSQARILVS